MFGIKQLKLSNESIQAIQKNFPLKYEIVLCSHITLEFGRLSDTDYQPSNVAIIGYQETSYLQVLVVSIDGSTMRSSDKKILHITLSHKPGITPVTSNDVLENMLFEKVTPLAITVSPDTVIFN
jgi:hypothetical protein